MKTTEQRKKNKKYRFYGNLLYYVQRILFSTLKINFVNRENIQIQDPYIYCFWHSKLVIPSIFFKILKKKVALSSPSKDGELISVPLEKLGYTLVRGSSDKKSVSSLINLLKYLKKGYSIGTPIDGPKGPREKAKKGLLYLSQKSGVSMIPLGVYYQKKWVLRKTWDKFEIPKPFSKVCILVGEEVKIPKDENIDDYIEMIENKINYTNRIAEKYLEENDE